MISRSALGKSLAWRKYFCGRSSPKNTTSGLTVAAQKEQTGTLSLMMAAWDDSRRDSVTAGSPVRRGVLSGFTLASAAGYEV